MEYDIDFKRLIPPISKQEYNLLRKSILKDGCRDAIVVWTETLSNGEPGRTMILDGHNRYEICKKNKIEFETICLGKELKDKKEARIWVIQNQLGRRNLTDYQRGKLTLELKSMIQEKAKQRMKAGKADPMQKSAQGKTREELARLAGVSHDTIHKIEVIEKEGTAEVKEAADRGQISINKAYKETIREQKVLNKEKQSDEDIKLIKKTLGVSEDTIRIIYRLEEIVKICKRLGNKSLELLLEFEEKKIDGVSGLSPYIMKYEISESIKHLKELWDYIGLGRKLLE